MRYLPSFTLVAMMMLAACSEAPGGAEHSVTDADPAAAQLKDDATRTVAPPRAGGDAATDEVVRNLFRSFDRNENGSISRPEALSQTVFMLISQDTDADGRISREEFHQWDVGFASLARERGNIDAFAASKDALFDRWDADGDEHLTIQEFTTGMARAFAGADQQSQGQLDLTQFSSIDFLRGFQAAAE